ncbi:MAG: ERF family protein [Nodosilinea sp. WJT8-NPBG4]|jgi:hypothetical protein|nr:ERF family protein [Nodosilinea sp. WJT8-NPBG4]
MEDLIKAVVKAKAEFKPLGRTATNTRFISGPTKGKYSSNSDVAESVDAALLSNGLFFTHKTVVFEGKQYLQGTLYHVSGQSVDAGMYPLNSSGDPQKLLGEITYARRGQKCAFFDVNADIDDDGNSLSPTPGKTTTPASKAPASGAKPTSAKLYAMGMDAFNKDGAKLKQYLIEQGVPTGNTKDIQDNRIVHFENAFKLMKTQQEVDF